MNLWISESKFEFAQILSPSSILNTRVNLIKKAIIFLLLNIFPFVIFLEVTMAILREKNKKKLLV